MEELVTIVLNGHSKITTMHKFLTRYEKLGYSLFTETAKPVRRRRKPPTGESAE